MRKIKVKALYNVIPETVELGNVVRKFLQYDEGDRTKYAEEFAQKYLGKGQSCLLYTSSKFYVD